MYLFIALIVFVVFFSCVIYLVEPIDRDKAFASTVFGMLLLLGDFVPSSGVALVLFIMVGLMLSYLTSLQPEDLEEK